MHERDLTNSSSERILVPHAFLVIDQMLEDMTRLLKVLYIDREAIKRNLELTGGAIMAESVVIRLVQKGLSRHEAHRLLMQITRSMRPGASLEEEILKHETLSKYLSPEEVREAIEPAKYLGNYSELIERALSYWQKISRC
jgi:adenylosuccinate lyase